MADDDLCAPSTMGGYDGDFLDPPPLSLQCPVCLLPFREPVLLSCCGHKGCAWCISRIKASGRPCPICQQPFDTMLDKQLHRKVLDLRTFCSKKGEGCLWVGELRNLQTHLRSNCDHVEEECRYKCGGYYQRRFLHDHEVDECPQRPPEVIMRSMIRKVAERMDKLEKAHHEDHQRIQKLQKENALILDERGKFAKKMEDLQGQMQKAFQAKLAMVENAHHQDRSRFSQQIQQLQKENASMQDEKVKLTRKIEQLETQSGQDMAALEAKLATMEKAYQKDHQTVDKRITNLSCLVPPQGPLWLVNAKGAVSSPWPPSHILIPQFSKLKRGSDQWYSQPFYSAPGGYKLCWDIFPNGFGSANGTHMSVFLHIMKGENDDQLQWPFELAVTYGIMNWKRDEQHIIKTINFKDAPPPSKQRVTYGEMAEGWGKVNFLSHYSLYDDAIKSTQYLYQDCLCLRVMKVEPPK